MADISKLSREQLLERKQLLERRKGLLTVKASFPSIQATLAKATGIRQRPPLGERIIGRIQATLPTIGQVVGGVGGAILGGIVKAPGRGSIVGGTLGRSLGRLGQLGISQFRENPAKFIKEVLTPLSGGALSIIRNAKPEEKEFMKREFLSTLGSEALFAGIGVGGKAVIKGVAGEFLGERVAQRGFESGFKKLTDPKFRVGRVPQEMAAKFGGYFKKIKRVAGGRVGKEINRAGVGNKLVAKKQLQQGLLDVEREFGRIDDFSINTGPGQKKILKVELAKINNVINRSKRGVSIGRLWDVRKNLDKTMFGRRFSEEATDYLKRVRSVLNTPIRQASPTIGQKFDTYSSLIDLEDELGKNFETRIFEGELFATKPERFASSLLRTAKDEQIAELKKVDAFLKADDRVIEDLLDLASAEELSKKIGAVTIQGKLFSGIAQGRTGIARGLQFAQQPFGIPRGLATGARAAIGRALPVASTELLLRENQRNQR